jgi:hypothetical protein
MRERKISKSKKGGSFKMRRISAFFISAGCSLLILTGCSSGDNNQASDSTKYLARNIVFSNDQISTAAAKISN